MPTSERYTEEFLPEYKRKYVQELFGLFQYEAIVTHQIQTGEWRRIHRGYEVKSLLLKLYDDPQLYSANAVEGKLLEGYDVCIWNHINEKGNTYEEIFKDLPKFDACVKDQVNECLQTIKGYLSASCPKAFIDDIDEKEEAIRKAEEEAESARKRKLILKYRRFLQKS